MDPAEDLEHAVGWYLEAIPPGRALPPAPPVSSTGVDAIIEQINAEIVPFRLPTEIEWLWRTWRPDRFAPIPHPRLTDPANTLELWDDLVGETFPRSLYPIAYESHAFLLVELGRSDEEPAPIWRYAFGDRDVVLTYPSLATVFRACASMAEAAGVRPPARDEDRWAAYGDLLNGAGLDQFVEGRMAVSSQDGRERHVPVEDLRAWPTSWRLANGVTEDSIRPLGATHTVQEFADAAASGPVVGRIVGRLRNRGGGSWGAIATLSDATGSFLVLKPRSVVDVGGRSLDDEVEIEVTASGPIVEHDDLGPSQRAVIDAALARDLDTASVLGADLARQMEDRASGLPVVSRIVPMQ